MKPAPPLTDQDFLTQFENQTLSPVHFKHIGHLRLTWLYLNGNELEEAIKRTCAAIQAYAESLGVTDKFHLTLTDALVRIMASRIALLPEKTWACFLSENDDLVQDALSVLSQHFSQAVLFSDEARLSRVQPDLKPF